MFDIIKSAIQPTHEAHLFEIDREKLKDIYNFSTKRKVNYEIIEKKIICARDDNNKNHLSKEDIERKYFSTFKFFKEYLTTGFETDDIKQEIVEMKQLVEHSKTLRENLINHFGLHNEEEENNKLIDGDANLNNTSTDPFKKIKILNTILKSFKLLTLKSEGEKKENDSEFKFYSELNNPSDIFSFSINENFLSNKLLGFKNKLTKSYYKEEEFSNFAKNYRNNKTDNNITSSEIKQNFPIEYIDSIFRPRESESFYQIDSFMSIYGMTQKANLNEKDLYENIYGILSKCNYENFMSYLYTKNNLFKYIYDEFASKKGNLSESLENVNLSRIDSVETEGDKFFKGGDLIISPKDKIKDHHTKAPTIKSHKDNFNFDDCFGSYYFDKISFLNEKIEDKIAEILVKETNTSILNTGNNIQGQFIKGSILNLLKLLVNKDLNHILLINKNEKFKIFNHSSEDDNRHCDIDEDVKKIQIYKIDRKYILDRFTGLASNLNNDNNFREIFSTFNCFFIVEVKKYINKRGSELSHKSSLNQTISSFYIFRISNENVERFDMICNQLKIYEDEENTNQNVFINNDMTYENENQNFNKIKENDDMKHRKSLITKFDNDNKNDFKSKRVSAYDEDFLGIDNDDILKEVLYTKAGRSNTNLANKNLHKNAQNIPNTKYEEEDDHNNQFDFKNLINKEQKKMNSNSNFEENDINNPFQEINFKENYMFRFNNVDHKFSFTERNGNVALCYYKYSQEDEDNYNDNKTETNMNLFKEYSVNIDEGKDYHRATIHLKFNESNKAPLEIISYVKSDYNKFISKIDKFLKKA